MDRRRFLQWTLMGGAMGMGKSLMGGAAQGGAPLVPERLGFQLYTLRSVIGRDPRRVLQEVAEIGYQEVEALRMGLDQLAPLYRELGLVPVSGHFETPLVTGQWDAWRAVTPADQLPPRDYDWTAAVDDAARHGLKFMVIPYLFPAERGDADSYRRLAEQLNKAGEASRKAGIGLCYHHHAFEFEPLGDSTPMQLLLQGTEANLVGIEVDVFWVSVAGLDPVEFIRQLRGRVPLVHLKDKAAGTAQAFREFQVPPESFKEVGNGELDFVAILKASREAGVQHFIVEQDHTPGDPVESLRQSYRNLRDLA
jgi:sugar phosphate isomerase/epimerase